MQITVLIDNNGKDELLCEWGLSFLIDTGSERILLDFGASDKFAQNAATLGVDLSTVDCAVLSHAHYDHGGGITAFLELNSKAPIYMASAAAEDCWAGGRSHSSKNLWATLFRKRYIGLPAGTIEHAGKRTRRISSAGQIGEHVWLIPNHECIKAGRRQKLYRMQDGTMHADDLQHELTLVCEGEKGLVVLNSCSHAGPGAILSEVKKVFPGKNIHAYIGGLHLYKTGRRGVQKTARALRDAGVEIVYTGHCTGDDAIAILNGSLKVKRLHSGLVIEG